MSRTRVITLPFILLALSPFVIFDSDYPLISCPLCKSMTLWNISMILGWNVEPDDMSCTRMTTLAFLLLELSLCFVWNRFLVCSVTGIPFGIFRWYLAAMDKRTRWCVTGKNDNSDFLLLALYPFVIFDSDNPLILCLLCKSKTLWNIFMLLGRSVEQDQVTCRVQEWQLWLSYFWIYLPLFCLKLISRLLCNWNTLWNISMVLGRNGEKDQTTCHGQEWLLCLSYFWRYLPFIFDSDNPLILCLLCKPKTLWNIFMILGRSVEQDQMTCHIQEWQLCLSYFWSHLPLFCLK